MRRRTISNFRQFLLALLLPAVAIATGLQSCNEEGPGIPAEENETAKSSGNPLMRSPEEAIDIAQRAYEEFYGDATPSSRGRSVIDCSRPVEVVRCARSRGGSSDTLLYIVNFVDDQGFAVIAAPRAADELLAVTSQGHYYPESDPEAGSVPGFDLWMEAAGDYAALNLTIISRHDETIRNNGKFNLKPVDKLFSSIIIGDGEVKITDGLIKMY